MKTLKSFFLLAAWWLCSVAYGQMTVVPTFECISVYLPYASALSCKIFYKKSSETNWRSAYVPVYDTSNKEFRGSIVKLEENTPYNVKAEIWNGSTKTAEYTADCTTWQSDVPVARTRNMSEFRSSNYYNLNGIKGTPNGWIRITADQEIDLLSTSKDYAVYLNDCQYVILDGITLRGGAKHGIYTEANCSDIRFLNCDISAWGRVPVDQNECGLYMDAAGNKINNDAGIRIYQSKNIVVERCYIHDARGKTNAWAGTVDMGPFKGNTFANVHPGGPNAIYVRTAKGGIVLRYNDFIGSQSHRYNDAVEAYQNGSADGGFHKDSDIYGNMFAMTQDDCIELDGGQCNVRMWGNRFEQSFTCISTAANAKGPSYIFGNLIFNLGDSYGKGSVGVKNGGGNTYSKGRTHIFNNTFDIGRNGINGTGYGSDSNRRMFICTSRNNIFQSSLYSSSYAIDDPELSAHNDFNYDLMSNPRLPDSKGIWRAVAGSEANGVYGSPQFADVANGIYTLTSSSPALNKGVKLDNFAEQFLSTTPDMGAFEYGASSLIPVRPIDVTANKYTLSSKIASHTVVLAAGTVFKASSVTIRKSDDMDWITITPSNTTLTPLSTLTLTVSIRPAEQRRAGVFLVRFADGMSIPISVVE